MQLSHSICAPQAPGEAGAVISGWQLRGRARRQQGTSGVTGGCALSSPENRLSGAWAMSCVPHQGPLAPLHSWFPAGTSLSALG